MIKKTAVAIFLITLNSLSADAVADIEKMFSEHRPKDLPGLASNLSAQGSIHHIKGDYEKAQTFFQKSLKIRKQIGLEMSAGYANILYLSSIADFRMGKSCEAKTKVTKVIEIYRYLGDSAEANQIESEGLGSFKKACEATLVAGN